MSQLLAPFVQMRPIDGSDIVLVTAIVYTGLVWLRRTQAWLVAAGMLILGAFYVVARVLELQLTAWIFQGFFAVFVVMIVVIFQEELRQMFEQLAVWGLGRARRVPVASETTDVIVRVLADLANAHIGALIVIPGRQPIARHVRGGIELNGRVSYPLLRSVFDTHSPGHDGAALIEGDR
jgi:DNA integrity scanning protein DisA with diadenylate cyclase activity